ncbi:hypothetical protein NQ318_021056 [Aromia moschata]|uniref:Uncharacterized protein n=1 Tax=Aromia moschata TaxID=1265417 RepID=A0AAV8YAS1_9CUCU|nr:hypothetical protein NQ318_021056 [Aromia moschata]
MLDSRRTQTPKFPQSESWSIDAFDTNDVKTTKVVRRFISSAIYVEKPITEMPPSRKTSPYFYIVIVIVNLSIAQIYHNVMELQQSNSDATRMDNVTTTRHHLESERSPGTNSSSDIESQITVKSKKPESPKLGSEMGTVFVLVNYRKKWHGSSRKGEDNKKNFWLWRKDQAKKQKI